MDLFSAPSVPISAELTRIVQLPRRVWTPEEAKSLAVKLTDLLRTPWGEMELRPIQAVALWEIGTLGGLLGPMTVGSGKTLVSLLAPEVSFAVRPLLVVPASLVDKTLRDRKYLAQHWRFPEFLSVTSYEMLGRAQAAEYLEQKQPDLIVLDEAHRLRNRKAAVTRRFRRFLRKKKVPCVVMSGTVTKRSLHDFAHLALWSLGENVPVPMKHDDLETWADALDERKNAWTRTAPGALKVFCNPEEKAEWEAGNELQAARKAYRRRLIETPGVVATYEASVDATLTIQGVELPLAPAVSEAFSRLRMEWETPDGWPIADGLAMARHARELALGFYYIWDPRPPPHWLEARRAWAAYVRKVLKHSHKLDSELQVRRAHPDAKELVEWLKVSKDFEPNTRAVWLTDSIAQAARDWAEANPGIVWTEHSCFGRRLAELGLEYYGREGKNAQGFVIEQHAPGTSLAASIWSNSTGRNLQAWSSNLVTSPPPNGQQWEQLLGRTHREGQEADEVRVDVFTLCLEHVWAFHQADKDARYVEATTGAPQKLLLAGVNVLSPIEIETRPGAVWSKSRNQE